MKKLVRNAVVATLLTVAGTTAVVASPAHALPYPKDNESITIVYYSDASRTVEVGMLVYGNCLDDFEYGIRTAYSTINRTTCPRDL
ncbi:hypothetical protein [Micromonospora carbonacea]|uniref:Uncharacterized protein n=1 Tax=Micromonospora carbonacea TaxID=47853 RepID=A0A7H8XFE8_9ACTN|nr:hypothetical protein [Micromonospora carbonacea]MBB5829578.1 hypothetical protein [Micromonospora carbonacea]QLD23019.1 hypothetical protein HXZ27_01145 [Micromonospora carbonacea]